MSITRPNPFEKAGDASKLSAAQLQQAIKAGTVPPYIGIPLLQEKVKMEKKMIAAAAAQQPKPPTVADQVMAEAEQTQGVPALQTNLPVTMAGGGIVAFAEGDLVDDEDSYDDRLDQARADELNDLMEQYAGLGALAKSMPEGRTKITSVEVSDGKGGLHPELESRVAELRAGYREKFGKDLPITSGFRTREDQERLYAQRGSNPNLVAKPGHSKHEHGMAVDLPAHVPEEFLRQYGLHRPHGKKDPVHVEMMAGGGAVHFQNRGLVDDEDYYTIPGLQAGNRYEEEMRKARGLRAEKAPYKPGQTLPGFTERMTTPESMDVEGLQPSTLYADAMKKARGTPVVNEPESQMMKAVKYPFRALGAGISSLYSNKTGMPSDTDYTASGDLAGAIMGERNPSAAKFAATANQTPEEVARLVQQNAGARGTPIGRLNQVAAASPTVAAASGATKTEPTVPASVKPSITPVEQGPKEPSELDQFKDMFAKREAGIASQREQDKYLAMLSAGLGIMGGRSQHAFENIGQGAQLGIQSLAQSNAQRAAEQNALMSGRLGLAKIGAAERQALAAQDLRKEMQQNALTQQKLLAGARSQEAAQALGIRQEEKSMKLLSDIESNARKAGEKKAELDPKLNVDDYVQKVLRSHKVYGPLFQEVYKRNPFEDVDAGGGGTRIKFDKQGNMIP